MIRKNGGLFIMTRHHLFTPLVLLASTAILAGCGVNGHPTASAGAFTPLTGHDPKQALQTRGAKE